jgi:hypothetical protein
LEDCVEVFLIVTQQKLWMEIGLVILIQLYRHLVEQTLDVFDIVVVFQLRINLRASDDHVELVQLQSKELSDLVSQVA